MTAFSNFKLKVISKDEVTTNVFLLKTKADQNILFQGGQYFSFKIMDKVNRSYSIASAPGEETMDFIVDITPRGPGSIFVENLNISDEFNVMGPFGFFNLEKTKALENEEPLMFVATGTGIAPMRSMIIDLLKNKNTKREIKLYFGMRYDNNTYYFDEMRKLSEEYKNFEFIPVISRPGEKWEGEKGYCQDAILKRERNLDMKVYVCGRTETVKAITESLIENGFKRENVFFEKFG